MDDESISMNFRLVRNPCVPTHMLAVHFDTARTSGNRPSSGTLKSMSQILPLAICSGLIIVIAFGETSSERARNRIESLKAKLTDIRKTLRKDEFDVSLPY